jgi:asparagine synthase (glutamine-hydrolysing)
MCGICGSTRDHDGTTVRAMSAALAHRGPDDSGAYTDPQGRIALGARRLSIIDVAGGHQPLSNEDGTVWAVLNGEIYNHPDLLERLRRAGHRLRSRCDTEVLVHLYEEIGPDLVHALEGMFAFAIWDEKHGQLMLGRDRFGEKPLFVHEASGELTFASEVSALRRVLPRLTLDEEAVDAFFALGYVAGPETIFDEVEHLPPGHMLLWDAERRRQDQVRYWRPPRATAHTKETRRDLQAETIRLLERSLRRTMVSDVPIGVFFSGGVDSALIAALLARLSSRPPMTFTVGFDIGNVSELAQARRTAKAIGTDHHEFVLTSEDVRIQAPAVFAALDQPLGDQALIPLHAVSQEARRTIKVAVGGHGADELFGGYPRYRWIHRSQILQARLPTQLAGAAARRLQQMAPMSWGRRAQVADLFSSRPVIERHVDWVTKGRMYARGHLYGERLAAHSASRHPIETYERYLTDIDRSPGAAELMVLDYMHWLPDDVLTVSDRAGMLVGLEIRTPYLSRELAEFATTVRTDMHLGQTGKRLLRGALSEYVPPSVTMRRKVAFRAPGALWLQGPLREHLLHHVTAGPLIEQGWIRRATAEDLARQHIAGTADFDNVLWPLLALGVWMEAQETSP